MLRVERRVFEKAIIQIITSTDTRRLIRDFSPYRIFFYSLLKDISNGEDSPNYHILKKIARDRKINEQFIIEQAKLVLSQFAPDEPGEDYYEILRIPSTASAEEIRKSWLSLMKVYHPDNMGDRGLDVTKKLNEAYNTLGDPVKRSRYDARRLPALPIIVSSPWVNIPSRKFAYQFSLAVVVCALAFYVVKSGLLFHLPVEKNESTKVEEKGLAKEVNTGREIKTGGAGLLTAKASSPSLKPVVKEMSSSEPKAEKGKMPSFSPEEQEGVFIARVAGAEKTPAKEEKGSLHLEDVPMDEPGQDSYVVKRGDSLSEIAGRFKISLRELRDANGLKGNRINTGQTLIIPQAGGGYAKEETEATEEYAFGSDKGGETKAAEETQEKLQAKTAKSAEPKKIRPVYLRKETAPVSGPDTTSLYSFVSQYVSAYKSRDITTFMSLFEPNARENGVEISKALESYMDNFSSLEIIKYDVKIRGINLKDDRAFTFADFDLTFRSKKEGRIKSTNGKIIWVLSWRNNHWRIKEINYKIKDVEPLGG